MHFLYSMKVRTFAGKISFITNEENFCMHLPANSNVISFVILSL